MKWLRPIGSLVHGVARALGWLVLWTLWLFLGTVLAIQLVVVSSHELKVPNLFVRAFESRLSVAGFRLKFEEARFDRSGHFLLENLELRMPGIDEPLATARSVYAQVDPWWLVLGVVDPTEIQAHGVTLFVPPMWSPTGAQEPVLEDVTTALHLSRDSVSVEQCSGHSGPVLFNVRGAIRRPPHSFSTRKNIEPELSNLLQDYLHAAQSIALWRARLATFQDPSLQFRLLPDAKHLARVDLAVHLGAAEISGDTLGKPDWKQKVELHDVTLRTDQPIAPRLPAEMTLLVSLGQASTAPDLVARHIHARVAVVAGQTTGKIETKEASVSIEEAKAHGVALRDLTISSNELVGPEMAANLSTQVADQLWTVSARGNPSHSRLAVEIAGKISPAIMSLIGQQLGRDLTPLAQLTEPVALTARASFNGSSTPEYVTGSVAGNHVLAHGVAIDRFSGRLFYGGDHFSADDVVLDSGGNRAIGSYSMNTRSLDYRFLLSGHLRPVGIAGWFHDWWARFWDNFDFSAAAPEADVDVQGRWREPHLSTVFVYADCDHPVVRKVAFDHVRTSLFIRPDFYDAREIEVTRKEGRAHGTFTRSVDLEEHGFRTMDFSVDSTIDLHEGARIFGAEGLEIVEPFQFDRPPHLKLTGHLDGEASPRGEHQDVALTVESDSPFRFFDFPLTGLKSHATVRDHTIDLPDLQVGFAGGLAAGKARVTGREPDRVLNFDAQLTNVGLGEAIRTLEAYAAQRRGEKPGPKSAFQERLADGRLDLHAVAKGLYHDPYSFVGQGVATLRGAELAQINLLGALSQALHQNSLLGFTSWRLDHADATFRLEKERVNFSTLTITGPTAKLEAHGMYNLNDKAIAFHAKFFPFEQGKTLLASAVDLMLTPVSKVLELKLSGTLIDPKWFFEYGPTNLFRKIAGNQPETPPADQNAQPVAAPIPEPPPLLHR